MTQEKRIKLVCAVCHKSFEVGDNDKVFFDNKNVTRTICLPCQKRIKKVYGFGFKCKKQKK